MFKKELPKIRVEELWQMRSQFTRDFPDFTEFRAKIMKVGKVSEECTDGVEFHFMNSDDNYCLDKVEFAKKFEKIY